MRSSPGPGAGRASSAATSGARGRVRSIARIRQTRASGRAAESRPNARAPRPRKGPPHFALPPRRRVVILRRPTRREDTPWPTPPTTGTTACPGTSAPPRTTRCSPSTSTRSAVRGHAARSTLALERAADEIVLHAAGLDVARARRRAPEAAEVAPVEIGAAPASETVVLRFAAPAAARARRRSSSRWSGRMTEGLRGLYPAGDGIAATQFEAADARRVFPCFDEPGFKATWRLAVEAPQGVAVLSNGAPEREEDLGARRRVRFAETPPLPTYLVALVVGRLDAHPPVARARRPGPDLRAAGEARRSPASARTSPWRCCRGSRTTSASPTPSGSSTRSGCPSSRPGAMENAGLVTYREVALLLDPADRLARAEEARRRGGDPRARAPVVRQLGHHGVVGRPLAERGLRHLDGVQDRRRAGTRTGASGSTSTRARRRRCTSTRSAPPTPSAPRSATSPRRARPSTSSPTRRAARCSA